jgi:hypothetical protein
MSTRVRAGRPTSASAAQRAFEIRYTFQFGEVEAV